ncbi:amino acid ABC transporter permease [Halotalea alkalilenta]|uniref:amino acid ABC transporter permease n=1 Tax=Halotalea alkalilenta TaxID=376489 RepID=UPI0009ED2446|nr:amino acid ABC transporter permease [Halotalea alkalilenta]
MSEQNASAAPLPASADNQGYIAARQPPEKVGGLLVWLRKNLFSGPINSLISLVLLYLIVRIVTPMVQWGLIDATWVGSSRQDCTGDGACWVFVTTRLGQIIYGFYPSPERWRVDVTLAMFTVLLVWLVIPRLPYKKIAGLLTLFAFPVVAYFLLLGGSFGLPYVPTRQWGGLMLTLVIATVGIVCSIPLGILLALGRRSSMPFVKAVCVVFIEFWRGVPLITVLFMASVMFPLFVPAQLEVDRLVRALIGISFFWSAYMAEVVRSGLQAIPKGQDEAAAALGLGYWQRTGLVVLPQALKLVISGIVSTCISLFKDTTLVLIIGLFDLLGVIRAGLTDTAWLGYATEGYVFAAILFWAFCFSMSRYSQYLERRLHTGHR